MRTIFLLLPVIALSFTSYNSPYSVSSDNATMDNMSPNYNRSIDMDQSGTNYQNADNTGRNIRDRNFNTITPGSQLNNSTDLTITQNIRRTLVSEDGLSNNARNIKVVTINGVVTLRGPVTNADEKTRIERLINAVDNVRFIDNQLEITQPNQ